PQRGHARREVAVGAGGGRQVRHRGLQGPGQPRLRRGQRRAGQVDDGAGRLGRPRVQAAAGRGTSGGHGGPAPRTAAGAQEALGAQRLEGGGDGGAADGEGGGELPLGGQAGGDGQAAFEQQQPQTVGERTVGGHAARAGGFAAALRAQELGELRGSDPRGP